MTQNHFVAYYTIPKKKGLSLAGQKAIVTHFVNEEKGVVCKEFVNDGDTTTLKKAIAYSLKHQVTFVIASLDCISDVSTILSTKKKLGNRFKSCDLPAMDSLTLSIAIGLKQRAKELVSIRTKVAFEAKKAQGQRFGNAQNLTDKGRKLGLAKIKNKAIEHPSTQKVITIIAKCRKA